MKEVQDNKKTRLSVLRAQSLRELVGMVNDNNDAAHQGLDGTNYILKDDIVSVMKEHDTYFLLYYK